MPLGRQPRWNLFERSAAGRSLSAVKIVFTKLSDQRHAVRVERSDGKSESIELDSRRFLHFAVELELGLSEGVWGSVARCGSLSGSGLDGDDMALAETISGPMQTMMRTSADATEIHDVLARVAPAIGSTDLAERLHARLRAFAGRWAATPYGGEMELMWPDEPGLSADVAR